MAQYISKDAVVAEIERRMKLRQDSYRKYNDVNDFVAFEELEYLHDEFLPTLEVKEINSTDAFNEKAFEFFEEHLCEYINIKNANCDTFVNIDGDKLIDDFKKYMKGE